MHIPTIMPWFANFQNNKVGFFGPTFALVVAGNMELNKNVYLLLEKGIVTSTGITKEGYYMVKFEGEPDTCFFTFKPGNVNILTNAWFTTNNSLKFSHNNGILNVAYADSTARIIITRI